MQVPAWNTVGQAQQSPDISTLVQGVVDRNGWQSGGNMVFAIDSNYNGDREAESFEGSPGGAPLLHIEYTTEPQPNQPPTADFSFATTDLKVDFFDTSTDDNGIASWAWSFGDGGTSTSQNPIHTYSTAGNYSVELTVTDDDGESDSITKSVTVTALPVNQAPTAGFTWSKSDLTANFTDTSSDTEGRVVAWSWNFGDSNSSTVQSPTHTYGSAGA